MNNLSKCRTAGVDEVGRGPLAGPVVAAAVILPDGLGIEGLTDSKKLSETKREALYDEIIETAIDYAIVHVSVEEIDRINILQASLLAMSRAVDRLDVKPTKVLVDGNRLPKWNYRSEAIVKGDLTIPAISAASILAKVNRDREMCRLDQIYPGYGLAKHKGYPTKDHIYALEKKGVLDIHRKSFGPVKKCVLQSEQLF